MNVRHQTIPEKSHTESARRVAANEFEEKRIHVIMTQRRARREGGAGGVILFVYSSSKRR